MSPDKLVYVANQVAAFFKGQAGDKAAAATLNHLERYWEPRMRRDFLAHLAAGGEGLSPIARAAAEMMAAKEKATA
ncbi:MAG TPA: formate dehydrogenase subunit delta [Hyphomicrobiales bacterium]|nr:formate dehydrogenase subunit delta [Hyphomicrobiales bacterium]